IGTDQSALGYANLASDHIATVSLTQGGTYAVPPTVVFTGGGGSGATATAVLDGSGAVASVTITNGGSGYTSVPTVLLPRPRASDDFAIVLNVENSYEEGVEIIWPPAWMDFVNHQDTGVGEFPAAACPVPRKDVYHLVDSDSEGSAYEGETYLTRQVQQPPL